MATKTVVELIDDLDETSTADETVRFGLDGVPYEIDLSRDNAGDLRDNLARYLAKARKVGKSDAALVRHRSNGTAPVKANRDRNQAIRDWAERSGLTVSKRGRIAAEVQKAFDAAHPGDHTVAG